MHPTGIVLLAAGSSSRMGRPKQLLPFQGQPLITHILDGAVGSGCEPVIVVLGANAEQIEPEVLGRALIVHNQYWNSGIHSSIQAGVSALIKFFPDCMSAILTVCDQPGVDAELFEKLAGVHSNSGSRIVAASCAGIVGTPALFHRSLFDELISLPHGGAKLVIEKYLTEVIPIPFPNGALDIDTPDDYAATMKSESHARHISEFRAMNAP